MPDPPSPTTFDLAISSGCLLFWLAAYALIIKRGFQDKSYGMPVGALCVNLAWEFLLEFVFEAPYPSFRVGYILWLGFDVVILITVIKYAQNDFENTFMRKWVLWLIPPGILVAGIAEWAFMTAYNDVWGTTLGWLLDLVILGSMIGMLLRRKSVRGQSVYIALFILIGNAFGYVQCLVFPMPEPVAPMLMTHGLFPAVMLLNLIYTAMIWQQCRLEGINPWRRF